MKELNREDCERIYGCGINIAPALRGLGEFGEDFAHGAEGGIQLADALGLNLRKNPHQNTHQIRNY